MHVNRNNNLVDHLIIGLDNMMRTVAAPAQSARSSPADGRDAHELLPHDAIESRRLMRVNHTGEVCAQALYQGQSLTARNSKLRETFREAAEEENDHLAWCQERITNLGGKTSRLNPLFYAGSFAIGAAAGLAGDKTSAAFLAETEHQVVEHLGRQIEKLPSEDVQSRVILEQMREDEAKHASTAESVTTERLSEPVQNAMRAASKVMVGLSYWL